MPRSGALEPFDEQRICMFLDLRSSTSHAERLGSRLYGRLLQDCLDDLEETVRRHRITIYQYLGDGVVLSWSIRDGLRDLNCIEAFFHFRDTLRRRPSHYETTYGCAPRFKAGMSCGSVSAVVVGGTRRAVTYYGDALNTAARLEQLCNRYARDLLISEELRRILPPGDDLEIELVDDVILRGKRMSVRVYGVAMRAAAIGEVTLPDRHYRPAYAASRPVEAGEIPA